MRDGGQTLAAGVTIDGRSISEVILRGAPTPHERLVLFDNENVVAVRTQRWKYVTHDYARSTLFPYQGRGYPQLYDMQSVDPEHYSVAARHPDVLDDMHQLWQRATTEFVPLRSKEVPEPWRSMRRSQLERLTQPGGGSDPSKAP